MEYIS